MEWTSTRKVFVVVAENLGHVDRLGAGGGDEVPGRGFCRAGGEFHARLLVGHAANEVDRLRRVGTGK